MQGRDLSRVTKIMKKNFSRKSTLFYQTNHLTIHGRHKNGFYLFIYLFILIIYFNYFFALLKGPLEN